MIIISSQAFHIGIQAIIAAYRVTIQRIADLLDLDRSRLCSWPTGGLRSKRISAVVIDAFVEPARSPRWMVAGVQLVARRDRGWRFEGRSFEDAVRSSNGYIRVRRVPQTRGALTNYQRSGSLS